ncbi:MAG: EAL domain-containing protein [Sulfuricurvum sp.]
MKISQFIFLFITSLSLAIMGAMVSFHQTKYFESSWDTLYIVGFLLLISVSFWGIQRFLVRPLEMIMKMTEAQDKEKSHYFIAELSMLSQSLANTFHTIGSQNEKLKEALEESHYLDGILRTIADINQNLISAQTVEELIQMSCQRLSEYKGYGLCWITLRANESLEVGGCSEEFGEMLHRGMKLSLEEDEFLAFSPCVHAYRNNEVLLLNHLDITKSLASWSFIAKERGYGAFISLPLRAKIGDAPFGVLSLYSRSIEGFRPKEIDMLQELAGDIGFAVHSHIQHEEFTRSVSVDVVTKLSNRISLIDYLSSYKISSLAILNIDRFSDINDVYGISIGDQILAGYGHWLNKKVGETTGIFLYKLGSDEYALVFDTFQKVDDNIAFLEYLIDKTEEDSFIIDGIEVVLSITVGFDPQSDKLLEHATRALKQAKLEHKRFCVYTPLMGAKKEQANNIEWYKEIKEALEESRIIPYFQPIVDNSTHEIVKYEALIRLIKRDGTVIPPHLFLDIAKKIRLYPALTKAMIDGVAVRFEGKNIPVSINLSTEDLLNGELADYIEDTIVRYKIGKLMIFEILENEGISNYAEVSTFIDRFTKIGCSFAIDDFGSGYSNFDHLLKLNIDTLKIDGSLIKNLPHDHNTQIIVRHICDFAHEMGMSIVAEFVANEAIYNKVKELGIDASQGYYFYEPQAELLP